MALVSEYNSLIHNLRDMVATILPKRLVKCIKVEEFTAYSSKEHTDYKVTNLYITVKDVTIIVSFDFEEYLEFLNSIIHGRNIVIKHSVSLNIWIQNNNEGEGATVGVTESTDAAFQFIKAVLILNKVIKS